MKKIEWIMLTAGCAMLAILLRHMDFGIVKTSLSAVGAGFLLIFLQETAACAFNTLGWKYAFTPESTPLARDCESSNTPIDSSVHRISFLKLFKIRIAGDGLNYLTPSATLAGEWARTMMMGTDMPMSEKLASIAIAKITQALSMALISSAGIVWAFAGGASLKELHEQFRFGLWLIAGLFALIIIIEARAAKQKQNSGGAKNTTTQVSSKTPPTLPLPLKGADESIEKFYDSQSRAVCGGGKGDGEPLSKWAQVKLIDKNIMFFLKNHTGRFVVSTGFFTAAYLWGAFEAYWICYFLGNPVSISTAVLIELLSVFMDGIFFAVPGKAGTQEATKTAIFAALGMRPSIGFAFAIVRHLREILWALAGMALFYHDRQLKRVAGKR